MTINTMKLPASTMASAYRAGQSAGQNYVDIQRETNKYAMKPAEINKAAYQAQSAEKQVATEINARAKMAENKAEAYTTNAKMNIDHGKKLASINRTNRKAGIVAGVGMIASDMITESKMGDAPKRERADFSVYDKLLADSKAKLDADKTKELATPLDTSTSTSKPSDPTNTAVLNSSATPSTLSGIKKEFADAIAGPESGKYGYDAFNQGGAAGGTKVLGKSGSHKAIYGQALTDMTLGEIFHRQNTKQRGLSMDEHFKSGGLHAVGRYQFIGSTLQDEVKKMGLSPDTKFTPEVQDNIFFSHAKRVGNISPWVGPSVKYDAAERARLNNMIQEF